MDTTLQEAPTANDRPFAIALGGCRTDLLRFVARRTRNREDAEDITQQAMLKALRALASFRGLHLRAWLFSIARNLVNDRYREQERAEVVPLDGLREEYLSRGPQQVRSICECRERLNHCFACFALQAGLEEQVALLLADVHSLPDRISAERMAMPESSFKWLLYGARQRLHRHAGGTCPLVGKTGSAAFCAGAPGAHPVDTGAAGGQSVEGSRPHRSGISKGALEQLRRELVRSLGIS